MSEELDERPAVGSPLDPEGIRRAFNTGTAIDRRWRCGRLVLDGSRPFLLVLREQEPDDPLARLMAGEASYLLVDPEATAREVSQAVRMVAASGAESHGSFLVIEVWGGGERFRVFGPDGPAPATVNALERGLRRLDVGHPLPTVEVEAGERRQPEGHDPLLTISQSHELGVLLLGVEVPDVWRNVETNEVYPTFLRRLSHGFSEVVREAVFEFVKVQTGAELSSYRALGRRTLGDAVWEADRALAEIGRLFDILLLVAPTNADRAWERFRDGGYERQPELHYRLLPIDPDLLKRRLYAIRLEEVDDPAGWRLLRDKREELDKQISLLSERNSPAFLHGSIRLFGPLQASLLERAEEILDELPPPPRAAPGERVGADAFARLARGEFDVYRERYEGFESEVQVRPDLVGLMVSSGRLLIGRGLALDPARVDALLQHEVGTHVLTYVNGAAQPFLQLSQGFADYDELQEGLGVLAEYLVGGLTVARLRLLAARVLAVNCRIDGGSFIEAFRRLRQDHGFSPRTAFDITTRVYNGGGFTRDMIYLRGFVALVEYLREGGDLEPLYIGKIAARHLDVMEELRARGVLKPMPLLPRFLERPEVQQRLDALRDGLPIHAMVDPEPVSA